MIAGPPAASRVYNTHAVIPARGGAPEETLLETRTAFMRYLGQGHEIAVPLPLRDLSEADGPGQPSN